MLFQLLLSFYSCLPNHTEMEILEEILGDPAVWIHIVYEMEAEAYPEKDIPPFFFNFMLPFYVIMSVGRSAVLR